jgi:hypothetical protein
LSSGPVSQTIDRIFMLIALPTSIALTTVRPVGRAGCWVTDPHRICSKRRSRRGRSKAKARRGRAVGADARLPLFRSSRLCLRA